MNTIDGPQEISVTRLGMVRGSVHTESAECHEASGQDCAFTKGVVSRDPLALDPDRPIIVGVVLNGEQTNPVTGRNQNVARHTRTCSGLVFQTGDGP
jgi:hypothetical protein